MSEDLKKLKNEEAAKRPGGRRKGQGEKYDPLDPYAETLMRAQFGKYAGTRFESLYNAAGWIVGRKKLETSEVKEAKLFLETFLRLLCKAQRWDDFSVLHKIFKQVQQKEDEDYIRGIPAYLARDNFRLHLLLINAFLYVLRAMEMKVGIKQNKISKVKILSQFRIETLEGVGDHESSSYVTDANIYKAMRAMGLPKQPRADMLTFHFKEIAKQNDSRPHHFRNGMTGRFSVLRKQLKKLRKVSI